MIWNTETKSNLLQMDSLLCDITQFIGQVVPSPRATLGSAKT